MRQTIAFQATAFDCQVVQVDADPGDDNDPDAVPVAVLVFQSGQNVVLTVPVSASDAENMMNAFTEAEPHRGQIPEGMEWEPQPSGLPEGLFWMLSPAVVGIAVTPPQVTPDGIVPHWTLAFDDPEGSQVQVAVSDAMCVQVVRNLALAAHGELQAPEPGGDAPEA